MLGALLEQPGYDAAGLVRHRLVRPHGGGALLFAHALIRDGVYDLLLKSRRRELPRRRRLFAGRDPVLHAEHLDRAEDPGAPRAYLEAARAQAAAYRTEAALALVERGVALAHERADVFALTCYRGGPARSRPDRGINERVPTRLRPPSTTASAAGLARPRRGDAYHGPLRRGVRGARCGRGLGDRAGPRRGAGAHPPSARQPLLPARSAGGMLREHELSRACARRANSPELEARALGGLATPSTRAAG